MITLMHGGPWRPEQPKRPPKDVLQDAAWTTLSITVGLVLIPAIAIDEAGRALFPGRRRDPEAEFGPYIT
ncbi:hypothetical protein [Arthrobacter sp. efr-133-R2A-120]|uniref:hypothetical protein n=1 Tax=Arthrobacter sp. efr-133-R2A-120 TaxID=3040277 RepID=UPI00254C1E14|nr:hypothetical protein [Arthrobacter sp. efr-133-R2A-120]